MIAVEELLGLLPAEYLERLAGHLAVDAPNQVRLPGPVVFVCLLNTMANQPLVTQRLLQEAFTQRTGQATDHTTFGYRLGKIPPGYFEAILRHLERTLGPQLTRGEAQALRLRRADATTVSLSSKLLSFGIRHQGARKDGSGAYDRHQVKTVLQLTRDGLPDLLHLCRTQAEANDNVALGDPMLQATQPGDLWIFDAGCFDRGRLLALHQQDAGWLTAHSTQALRCLRLLWEAPPGAAPRPTEPPRQPVCRLVRVEEAVFEGAHDRQAPSRQQRWASMPLVVLRTERYDLRTQCWKPWALMTNLPVSADLQHAGPYPFAELLELYRKRWEIETFFKFLKQHLGYEHLTSRNENGIQVMIWMALITAWLLLWYRHRSGIDRGWRSVKSWFAEDARVWTRQVLAQHFRAPPVPP
jgi:Transposase DDE domain